MTDNLIAVADSLGWALLHSIWQVSLIAAIVFVTLRLISRSNPQLRFAAAYFGMVASAIAFVFTFIAYFSWSTPQIATAAAAAPATGWAAYVEMLGSMTWLVSLCWGLGFVALAARYFKALRATQMLRHTGVTDVPEEWENRFRLWLERLGADQRTAIRYSELISTPVTIGTFKPLILLPAGFFLRLPSEQAEAVLIHEIAHVCRQDYLLGLIQAMISNIFFFHPGIYFLSRQVDVEREYACDARAAEETGDATALAKGLSQIALESQVPLPGFAMAASGKRTPLMDRINRLADRPTRRDASLGTPVAALTMVFAASLMIAISADASPGKAEIEEAKAPEPMIPSEPAEPASEIVISDESIQLRESFDELAANHEPDVLVIRASTPATPVAPRRARKPHSHRHAVAAPAAPAAPVPPTILQIARLDDDGKNGFPLLRSAVYTPSTWSESSPHDGEQCEEERARREERIERETERAARIAERHAERAERIAERHAARAGRIAEQHAERHAERHARHAERHAERIAERAARRAEHLARNSQRLAAHAERMADQAEHRAEQIEREMEQRAREIERRARERERSRAHANTITISFAVIPDDIDG